MTTKEEADPGDVRHLEILVDRERFLGKLLRHLTGALQDVIGLQEVSGLLSLVGQSMGDEANLMYRAALQVERLSRPQVAAVLVDFKRRIGGEFTIVEQSDARIVLDGGHCPFAADVLGRPAMCMMTSNVFGAIASQNLGYARVVLEETIARGDGRCRVVIYLQPSAPALTADGREYFRSD